MSSYNTLLFDLDGTLTDPKLGITKSIQYALAHMDIHEPDLEKLKPFIGPPLAESFMQFYGFSLEKAYEAVQFYREYFAESGLYENTVYPGIPDLLETLQHEGKHLILATAKPTIFATRILGHFELDSYFEAIVGMDINDLLPTKTASIAHILAERPTTPKAEVVMIGDRKHDVIAAQHNEIDSIAVSYGYGSANELEACQPTYIVDTIPQLERMLIQHPSITHA